MFGQPDLDAYPVQLYHLQREGVRCTTSRPTDPFRNRIYYYWRLDIESPAVSLSIIPDTAIDLVIAPDVAGFSGLFFPKSEVYQLDLEGPTTYFGVCIPFAQAPGLFDEDIDALRRLVPGAETTRCLGLSDLHADLSERSELKHFGALIEARLGQRTPHKPSVRELDMKALLDTLERDQVAAIAQRWGVSERQFRRMSGEMFSLSPKKLQNIIRLQNTLAELLALGGRADLEFYDDSHRIRELKRLTGLTPGQIRKMAEKYNSGR